MPSNVDQYAVGQQPCQSLVRDDGSMPGVENVHSCYRCDKTVSFCTNCHRDHHEDGYETCFPSPPKDLMSVANSEERDVLRRLEWAAEQFDNYDVCCDNSGCSGCDGRGDSNECLTLAQDVKEQAQWLRSFAASYSPLVRETLPEIKQNVPGQIACHAIVTGACRANRGRFHAVTEALDRLKNEYDAIMMEDWPYETKLHFVLSIERAPVSTDTNTVNTANGSALPPETGS